MVIISGCNAVACDPRFMSTFSPLSSRKASLQFRYPSWIPSIIESSSSVKYRRSGDITPVCRHPLVTVASLIPMDVFIFLYKERSLFTLLSRSDFAPFRSPFYKFVHSSVECTLYVQKSCREDLLLADHLFCLFDVVELPPKASTLLCLSAIFFFSYWRRSCGQHMVPLRDALTLVLPWNGQLFP